MVKGAVLQLQLCHQEALFVTGRDREVRGATPNWPSFVWVREGLAGRDILVSLRTSDSCGAQCTLTKVARCTVFPPTHCFRVGFALC